MKKLNVVGLALFLLFFGGFAVSCISEVSAEKPVATKTKAPGLTWHSMEDLEALMIQNPKKVVVDVYTDWCKWCKVMDKETFQNPEFIEFAGDEFYFVKLNAEQASSIQFKNAKYDFVKGVRRGHHQLAASLLDGRLSYPSFAILDESLEKLDIIRGFKDAPSFQSLIAKAIQ